VVKVVWADRRSSRQWHGCRRWFWRKAGAGGIGYDDSRNGHPGIVGSQGNNSDPGSWEGEFAPQGEIGENGYVGKNGQ
jgi:hypothetical protein